MQADWEQKSAAWLMGGKGGSGFGWMLI